MIEILVVIFGTLIFLCLVSLGWSISTYNTFIALKQDISTQWSNITTEYQRRIDLYYNLVQSVKSFKKHERETLKEIVTARSLHDRFLELQTEKRLFHDKS